MYQFRVLPFNGLYLLDDVAADELRLNFIFAFQGVIEHLAL